MTGPARIEIRLAAAARLRRSGLPWAVKEESCGQPVP